MKAEFRGRADPGENERVKHGVSENVSNDTFSRLFLSPRRGDSPSFCREEFRESVVRHRFHIQISDCGQHLHRSQQSNKTIRLDCGSSDTSRYKSTVHERHGGVCQ